MSNSKFLVGSKVWAAVAETSVLGGGRHRAKIENIVEDMFDGTILYLVKIKGTVVPVREGAMELMKIKSNGRL